MKFIYTKKNVNLSDELKEIIEKKLKKVGKFFKKPIEIHITLSTVNKTKTSLEITIPYKDIIFRAEVIERDILTAIDKANDILEKQIRRNKTRLQKRLHEKAFANWNNIQDDVDEEDDYKVVKSKKFAIKPMSVEEAILQMNLLGHNFFMFKNADTEESNVVYKRTDGNYGLIEPEI